MDLGLFPVSQGHTLKVLIVDDDRKAVELTAVPVLALSSIVLRAYGGREAIEAARQELPDLIVLDLMMPEVNGFDVVEALKLHPEYGPHSDPSRDRQEDHRRGPRQAEWLCDDDHGKDRVRPRPLYGRSPAGHVGPRGDRLTWQKS